MTRTASFGWSHENHRNLPGTEMGRSPGPLNKAQARETENPGSLNFQVWCKPEIVVWFLLAPEATLPLEGPWRIGCPHTVWTNSWLKGTEERLGILELDRSGIFIFTQESEPSTQKHHTHSFIYPITEHFHVLGASSICYFILILPLTK